MHVRLRAAQSSQTCGRTRVCSLYTLNPGPCSQCLPAGPLSSRRPKAPEGAWAAAGEGSCFHSSILVFSRGFHNRACVQVTSPCARTACNTYLSTGAACGANLPDLYYQDDGSGRQQWQVPHFECEFRCGCTFTLGYRPQDSGCAPDPKSVPQDGPVLPGRWLGTPAVAGQAWR